MKAAEQPGIFSDIRRAVQLSRRPIAKLAAEIVVEKLLLSDFVTADADIPANVGSFDRDSWIAAHAGNSAVESLSDSAVGCEGLYDSSAPGRHEPAGAVGE